MKKIITLLMLMMSVYSIQAEIYEVATTDELVAALNDNQDEYKEIYLLNDIDLTNTDSFSVDENHPFYGIFDGQGYALKNFSFKGADNAALFGFSGRGFSSRATFRNLVIEDFQVEGREYVAFLVARPQYTLFTNIKVVNHYPLLCSDKYCGVIAGKAADCVFELCSVSGNSYVYAGNSILGPAGDASVGGICGQANDCLFYRCVNQSDVYSHNQFTGGICGNLQDSSMHSCVNTGYVSSGVKITDSTGASVADGKTKINCDAHCLTGGLVGLIRHSSIRNSIMSNSVKSADKGNTAIVGVNLLSSNYGYIVNEGNKFSNNYFVDADMTISSDLATAITESMLKSGEIASALNIQQNTDYWRQQSGEGFPNPTFDDFEESNNTFNEGDVIIIDDESFDDFSSDNVEYYDLNKRRIPELQKGFNIVKQGNKTFTVMVK